MSWIDTLRGNTLRGLTARDATTIDALLRSPEALKAREAVERETLTRRTELIAQRKLVSADTKERDRLVAEEIRSKTALDRAEAALREADAAYRAAYCARIGNDAAHVGRLKAIDDELHGSADPRLDDFIFYSTQLADNELKLAPDVLEVRRRNWLGEIVVEVRSNDAECRAANAAIAAVAAQARAMQFADVSRAEVNEALEGWCATLSRALSPLDLNPPALTRGTLEVRPPLRREAGAKWLVDSDADEKRMRAEQAQDRIAKMKTVRAC